MMSTFRGGKGRGGWNGDGESEPSSEARSGRLGRRSSRHNGNDEEQEGSHQHLRHGDQPCEPKKRHAGKKPNRSWSRNRKKPQGGLTRLPGRSRLERSLLVRAPAHSTRMVAGTDALATCRGRPRRRKLCCGEHPDFRTTVGLARDDLDLSIWTEMAVRDFDASSLGPDRTAATSESACRSFRRKS